MISMYTTQQCLPRTHHTSTTCKAGCSFSWHCILVVVCLRWQCQASVAFSVQHFCDHVLHGEYRVINGHGNGMIIYKARLLPGTNTTVRSRPTTALPLVANGRRWKRAITWSFQRNGVKPSCIFDYHYCTPTDCCNGCFCPLQPSPAHVLPRTAYPPARTTSRPLHRSDHIMLLRGRCAHARRPRRLHACAHCQPVWSSSLNTTKSAQPICLSRALPKRGCSKLTWGSLLNVSVGGSHASPY